jgi:transcriptional regulator of acetoin/glycerol metabolism
MADTRYFAILTNAAGVVVDVNGPIDRSDRRADVITRIGVDLSEAKVGTTAIGAALTELQPVWLHRGEHFFDVNSAYSCAGAPLFGPGGQCVGMLDLTGIDAIERPELKHLAAHSARNIENALTLIEPHELTIRLNWPGHALDEDTDGLVCLDANGWVTGANSAARQMIPQLVTPGNARDQSPVHCSELFAMNFEALFDSARPRAAGRRAPIEVPLWSGLRLHALTCPASEPLSQPVPLKVAEAALIQQAVAQARGNVKQAAQALGVSRATVYRKLGAKKGS